MSAAGRPDYVKRDDTPEYAEEDVVLGEWDWTEDMRVDLPERLRARTCPDWPNLDHGHTDCLLMRLAADEIERLREHR